MPGYSNPRHNEAFRRMNAGEGFIYVAEIVGHDMVKIGFSLNPEFRVRGLTAFLPPARLLTYTPGSVTAERQLHRTLAEHALRLRGSPRRCECYRRSILSHPAIPTELRSVA
jgi:hypothetical protein